ncbi:MAG TPA: CBS domain-containing protein [Sedimentisphaerales bacterium]|nr:CBS domain-containing protein [Sedimentisphaerales bacterium]
MLTAKDIMTKDVAYTKKDAPIYKAVKLLIDNEITGIPVVQDDMTLVGILTEKDVLRLYRAPAYGRGKTVDDFMTQPAVHFDQNESLDDICNCLIDYTFRSVLVTSKGKLVGIISRPDIIKCIMELAGESAVTSGRGAMAGGRKT